MDETTPPGTPPPTPAPARTTTTVTPSSIAFTFVLLLSIATLAVGGYLLIGVTPLPDATQPSQLLANYFAIRLIPIGALIAVIGFVVAVSSAAATAMATTVTRTDSEAGTGLAAPDTAGTIGAFTELIKAASSLAAVPAGIGLLLLLLGAVLLLGGAATAPSAAGASPSPS